jgi:LmbE family N-acetylglucosaminyl deacetylase
MSLCVSSRQSQPAQTGWLAAALGANSHMLDGALLQDFAGRRAVILSPHFDDACFSLGSFLAHLPGSHLVNIFTQGRHLARESLKPFAHDQKLVHGIRDSEDAGFAARYGLWRYDLGCEEPVLRARRPGDLSGLDDDRGQILRPVRDCLLKLAGGLERGTRPLLFAPMGVGGHVNHRAVAAIVLELLPLLSLHYDVFLYEELPYAGSALARLGAIRRTRAAAALTRRFAYRTHWGSKRELLGFYASQFRTRPRARAFRPAAPFTPFAHEAFWSVTRG